MSDCIPVCENCLSYPGEYKFCPITGRCCRDNLLYESCSDFEQKRKPTNGDKIRQGGNRALAQFAYMSLRICRMCTFSQLEEGRYECTAERGQSCIDGIEAWLNAPAKEGENELSARS